MSGTHNNKHQQIDGEMDYGLKVDQEIMFFDSLSLENGKVEEMQNQVTSKIADGDLMGIYLQDVRGNELLTWEEEADLAGKYRAGIAAKKELCRCKALPENKKLELNNAIKLGKDAESKLFLSNVRLAINIAKRYANRGVAILDLVQEANLGLLKAITKFDERKGYRFSTYATWWIRQNVSRALCDHGRSIRIPVHTDTQLRKLIQIRSKLIVVNGEDPCVEDLAAITGFTAERVEELLSLIDREIYSLDTLVGYDESSQLTFGDFVEDPSLPVEELVTNNLLKDKVGMILSTMKDKTESLIIKLRFGLATEADGYIYGKGYSCAEIAQALNIELKEVTNAEARGLYYLRGPQYKSMLKEYAHN